MNIDRNAKVIFGTRKEVHNIGPGAGMQFVPNTDEATLVIEKITDGLARDKWEYHIKAHPDKTITIAWDDFLRVLVACEQMSEDKTIEQIKKLKEIFNNDY